MLVKIQVKISGVQIMFKCALIFCQVDLQSSEKEKEKLSAELHRLTFNTDEVKRENQELSRRLSQQETQQSSTDDDLRVWKFLKHKSIFTVFLIRCSICTMCFSGAVSDCGKPAARHKGEAGIRERRDRKRQDTS